MSQRHVRPACIHTYHGIDYLGNRLTERISQAASPLPHRQWLRGRVKGVPYLRLGEAEPERWGAGHLKPTKSPQLLMALVFGFAAP